MKNITTILFILLTNLVFTQNTNSAMYFFNKGELDSAQSKFTQIVSKETNKDTLAKCYHYLGNINYQKSDFVKSLGYFKKSESLYSELGNAKKVSNELNNIGLIYLQIGELDKSRYYILKSLNNDIKRGETNGLNETYTNLYVIENSLGNYLDAEKYARESIKWSIKSNDTIELAKGYSNLGVVLMNTKKYQEALSDFYKSINISTDSVNIGICYNNIGFVYYKMKKLSIADSFFTKSINVLKRFDSFNYLKDIYNQVHEIKYEKGDYKSSIEYFKLYISVRDSLVGADNKTLVSKMITDYDNKFKTKERESHITELELQETNSKQKITFLFIIVVVTLISIFLISFLLYKSWKNYKEKKKLSDNLSISNKELGDRNKDITDSIQYAKRLQNGVLGDPSTFTSNISNLLKRTTNLLYMPKDIVSGDFYWSYSKNGNLYIAIGDCTGHGVPGSMITIVGHTSLTKIVEEGISDPGEILTKLDKMVKSSFSGGSDIRDGMDITLVKIGALGKVEFAGGNNFMYLRKGNDFEVIKGDKCYVGSGESTFITKNVDKTGASHIYMMTDGIIDQFGGGNGKKFKQTGLKSSILESTSFNDITNSVNRWKDGYEQTDDITFLEIKLK